MKILLAIVKGIGIGLACVLAFFLFLLGLFVPIILCPFFLAWVGLPEGVVVGLTFCFAAGWAVMYPAFLSTFD